MITRMDTVFFFCNVLCKLPTNLLTSVRWKMVSKALGAMPGAVMVLLASLPPIMV